LTNSASIKEKIFAVKDVQDSNPRYKPQGSKSKAETMLKIWVLGQEQKRVSSNHYPITMRKIINNAKLAIQMQYQQ